MSKKYNRGLTEEEKALFEETGKTDFDSLKDDFMDKCGYSKEEAEIAAKNVLLNE